MSGIRGKDTRPEMLIRRRLHALGFRYRLHDKKLPGRPDLVLPKHKAVIFVHGCFWHGHGCALFKWPSSRPDFWRDKIGANMQRDFRAVSTLKEKGWRIAIVWECSLRPKGAIERVVNKLETWIQSHDTATEIRG